MDKYKLKDGVMRETYYHVSLFFAALTLLFGLSAAFGWVFEINALLQYIPGTEHIVMNTAISFIAMTLAVLALFHHYQKTVWFLTSAVSLLSLLVLSQLFITLPFNPDTLFFQHSLLSDHPTPGRMAPNTCVGFIMASGILLLLNRKTKTLIATTVASLIGTSLLLKGYYFAKPMSPKQCFKFLHSENAKPQLVNIHRQSRR